MLACMITPRAGEPGGAATVQRPAGRGGYGSAERIQTFDQLTGKVIQPPADVDL